jgi:hypothetical protein
MHRKKPQKRKAVRNGSSDIAVASWRLSSAKGETSEWRRIGIKIPIGSYAQKTGVSIGVATTADLAANVASPQEFLR